MIAPSDPATDATTAGATPVVDLRAVSRTFDGYPPVRALLPTDLRIAQGDFVTIVGRSGSGKSTLLNVLGLLDRPTAGSYLLDGLDVGELTESERTSLRGRRIGFVFQSFQLVEHRPAVENVMMAMLYRATPRAESLQRSRDALELVGLSHRAEALPSRMSGGERQRVAIARAVVGEPSLLLCDEPTGNLDSATSEMVLTLFGDLHGRGSTIVLITHDAAIAERGTRQVRIRDGALDQPGAERAP